jgi:membrane protein required for colicin V production
MMDGFPFNILDTVIVVVLGLSALIGLFRGFAKEVLSLAAWVGAAWVTLTFFADARYFTLGYIEDPMWAGVIGGAGLFLLSLVVLMIVARLLAKLVKSIKLLGPIDWTLGFGFGVLRGAVIVSLTYLLAIELLTPAEQEPEWVAESRLLPYVEEGAAILQQVVPVDLPAFDSIRSAADKANEKGYTPDEIQSIPNLLDALPPEDEAQQP